MIVYVVTFEPDGERSSVGGFDWYIARRDAEESFAARVASDGDTDTIRLVETHVDGIERDEITMELDIDLDLLYVLPALREHEPPVGKGWDTVHEAETEGMIR